MTYPASPEFSAINVDSISANIRSETRSGRTQVRSIGAQRWRFTARYNDLTRDDFAPVYAFIMSTGGGFTPFEIIPPVISDTSGDATGLMAVNGSHSAGDSTISVDGFTGTIKAGDFVKFASHTKVYMVTADLTGAGVLNISPALLSSVSNDNAVTYTGVPFTMRLSNDTQKFSAGAGDRYKYEVDMIEVI